MYTLKKHVCVNARCKTCKHAQTKPNQPRLVTERGAAGLVELLLRRLRPQPEETFRLELGVRGFLPQRREAVARPVGVGARLRLATAEEAAHVVL